MQCYHRKLAWITDKGLSFKPVKGIEPVSVPCGKCDACRVNNAAQWATRSAHEEEYCDNKSSFITLTYDKEHCPKDYCLSKADLQDFMKRLRTNLSRMSYNADYEKKVIRHIRAFFACGEYGTLRGRPHYHVILFNYCPPDLYFWDMGDSGLPVFRSPFLEKVWSKGMVFVGSANGMSAAYVARYQKKLGKDNTGDRVKPFFLSSRNIPLTNGEEGALGSQWVLDHYQDLRLGYVMHSSKPNVKCKIPDYYFKLVERWFPDFYLQLKKYRYDYAMDMTNGFMIVEDSLTHQTSFRVRDQSDTTCKHLVEYAQEAYENQDFETAYHLAIACLKRQENKQNQSINKLKRNYE